MKRAGVFSICLLVWAACSGGGSRIEPEPQPAPVPPDPQPQVRELVLPGDLSLTRTGEGVVLSWKDLSTLEEGYLIEKSTQSAGVQSFFLPANSSTWKDEQFSFGITKYSVAAYWHMERSASAKVQIEEYGKPEVSLKTLSASYHMVAAEVSILSDGGRAVQCGVDCLKDGELVFERVFGADCVKGQTAWLLFEDLQPDITYQFKPWVQDPEERIYGEEKTSCMSPLPEPLSLPWEDLSSVSATEGLTLKKVSTNVFGSVVNMWCAIADLSDPSLELRTTIASTLTEPGPYIRDVLSLQGEVLVLVNGGYFASPAMSYSYVCDRGQKKASNVSLLTRTEGYSVTRGFFGVDEGGTAAIGWQSGDEFWARPLPVYDSGPVLSLSSDHPKIEEWTPYSAVGGGPVLIKDGRYCFDFLKTRGGYYLSNHELFLADIYADGLKAPRTAIGVDNAGKIILLVADGRGSGGSAGLTLEELARVMAGLGCTDVMNLDGGGSSMFLTGTDGTLQNAPSDGRQRKILSYVSIMKKN